MMVWGSSCNFRPTGFAQSEATLTCLCTSMPFKSTLCNRRHLKSHLYRLLGLNRKKKKKKSDTNGTKIKLNCTLCKITDMYIESSTERTALVNTIVSKSASLRLLTLNSRATGVQPRATKCSCAYKSLPFFIFEPGWHFRCPYMPSAGYIHLGTSHSPSQRINLSTSDAIKAMTRVTNVPKKG